MLFGKRFLLILIALFLFSQYLFAAEEIDIQNGDSSLPQLKTQRVSGPYCGIYSLYFSLDSIGLITRLEDYMKPEYVGSHKGSSAKELIAAAEHFGAHAEIFSHLTYHELKRINQPILLHIRSHWADGGYNHWVAFLGFDGSRVRILDPLQNISAAELLANWDGTGIVVSQKPVQNTFIWEARRDLLILIVTLFAIAFILHRFFEKTQNMPENIQIKTKRLIFQTAALVLLACVLGIGYHTVSHIGFLQNPTALAEVTRRYYFADIPEISLEQMEKELSQKETPFLIDARRSIDFQHGAISQAVSMPMDSSLPERRQVLKGISPSRRIIVYCQSSGCGYADEIAKFLKFNGYENLVIYRGGYRDWQQTRRTPKNSRQ
ncbi:MAG: hypothetical protein LBT05_13675 [Planctomycetaceae bacterium]|nr:hypothetical protein [Planctomycetaceae bacterium]